MNLSQFYGYEFTNTQFTLHNTIQTQPTADIVINNKIIHYSEFKCESVWCSCTSVEHQHSTLANDYDKRNMESRYLTVKT